MKRKRLRRRDRGNNPYIHYEIKDHFLIWPVLGLLEDLEAEIYFALDQQVFCRSIGHSDNVMVVTRARCPTNLFLDALQ